MSQVKCGFCEQSDWSVLGTVDSGAWKQQGEQLLRNAMSFSVAECKHCSHVQIKRFYDEEVFDRLYFANEQIPVFWHDSLVGSTLPYEEMCDFIQPYLLNNRKIIDLGCGSGDLLSVLRERTKGQADLLGMDFNYMMKDESIAFRSLDLNRMESLKQTLGGDEADIVMASHVMEHVVDPKAFLLGIRNGLKDNGHLFLELPDFSPEYAYKVADVGLVVCPQHIHYFSYSSAKAFALSAGYEVEKHRVLKDGYISRLQMVLRKVDNFTEGGSIEVGAGAVVRKYIKDAKHRVDLLGDSILEACQQYGECGVWGVGTTLCEVLDAKPKVFELLSQGKIRCFDMSLSGYYLHGAEVKSPELMQEYEYPVFLTPLHADTRYRMRKSAAKNNVRDVILESL